LRGAGRRLGLSAAQQPEDAAEFYFDNVLDRPIGARGEGPSSADNLATLVGSHAIGPRAVRARRRSLSIWKALMGGEPKMRRFLDKRDLFELSNRILKCLDAANRPYAEVLRLGLCPKEWLVGDDAVGVNTLKAANAFLKIAESRDERRFGRRPDAKELEVAFFSAPIPGYKDAKAFAASLLGSAILTRLAGQDQTFLLSFDVMEATQSEALADEADEPLMNAEEAAPFPRGRRRRRRHRRPGNDPARLDHGRAVARRRDGLQPLPATTPESRFRQQSRGLYRRSFEPDRQIRVEDGSSRP
jgi:hypothetical protein